MDNVTVGGGGSVRVLNISDVVNQLVIMMADVSVSLARSIQDEAGRLSSGTVELVSTDEVNAVRGRVLDRLGALRAISDMFDLMEDGERKALLDRTLVSQAMYAGHDGLVDSSYELLARAIASDYLARSASSSDSVEDGLSGNPDLVALAEAEAGSAGDGGSGVADVVGLAMPEDDDDDTVTDGLILVAGDPLPDYLAPLWSGSMMVNGLTYGL